MLAPSTVYRGIGLGFFGPGYVPARSTGLYWVGNRFARDWDCSGRGPGGVLGCSTCTWSGELNFRVGCLLVVQFRGLI